MATPGELDAIEEESRQLAAKQKVTRTKSPPNGKQVATPPSLLAALERDRLVESDLDEIVSAKYPEPVVSLYLSLSQDKIVPEKGFLKTYHSLKHRALTAAEELIGDLGNKQKQLLNNDLAEVEAFLLNDFDPSGARGVVVLKSGTRLRLVAGLPIYLRDVMVIDPDPYTKPLLEVFAEYRPVLVVRLRRGEAQLSIYQLGRWQGLPAIKDLVSKASTKAGKAGKAERIYEEQLLRFSKQLVEKLETLYMSGKFQVLVLVGEPSNTRPVMTLISAKLKENLALVTGENPEETSESLAGRIEAVLADLRFEQEREIVKQLEELPDQERLVKGLGAVVEALNRSMVRQLLVSEQLHEPGYRCGFHQFLSLEAGKCAFCQRRLLPVHNLVDSAIESASRQGVKISIFRRQPELLDPDGIAAITYSVDTG